MDHTVLPASNTISAFTRKHSAGGAIVHIRTTYASVPLTTHLSTPREWMAELAMLADIQRTVYPKKVTGQLHVMVQGRKSYVLTTVLCHQQNWRLFSVVLNILETEHFCPVMPAVSTLLHTSRIYKLETVSRLDKTRHFQTGQFHIFCHWQS